MTTRSIISPGTRERVRGLVVPVATAFGRLGLTPNHLTLIGFAIAIASGILAWQQSWLLAGLLVLFGGVFDLLDGALARATNRVNRFGAFMDSVFDRWGEAVVYLGIAAGCLAASFNLGAWLAAAAMGSAALVSYVRSKSEGLGLTAGSGMANVGIAPREVRIAVLTVGLVLAGLSGASLTIRTCPVGSTSCLPMPASEPSANGAVLAAALGLIAILATITTIQRIVHVINQTRGDTSS
jgi:phosphatidylglycerophosphate synthase